MKKYLILGALLLTPAMSYAFTLSPSSFDDGTDVAFQGIVDGNSYAIYVNDIGYLDADYPGFDENGYYAYDETGYHPVFPDVISGFKPFGISIGDVITIIEYTNDAYETHCGLDNAKTIEQCQALPGYVSTKTVTVGATETATSSYEWASATGMLEGASTPISNNGGTILSVLGSLIGLGVALRFAKSYIGGIA